MRECPDCGRQFSSGASYRVHKHRFHRNAEASIQGSPSADAKLKEIREVLEEHERSNSKQEEPKQPEANTSFLNLDLLEPNSQGDLNEKADSDDMAEAPHKDDESGSWDWLVWLGAAAVAALAFLGWRNNGQQ